MENTTNETNHIVESPFNKNKKINVIEAFDSIQQVLKENHRSDDGTNISDKLNQKMSIFEMVLKGVDQSCYGDMPLTKEDCHGISVAWYEVKELIGQREEEHSKIWNFVFRGSEKI